MPWDKSNDSLAAAREWVMSRRDDGSFCPCCDQWSESYKNKIYWKQVWVLRAAHKRVGLGDFHLPSLEDEVGCRGACAILAKWDLLVPYEEGGKKVKGRWCLTEFAVRFLEGYETVPKYKYVYNNEVFSLPWHDRSHVDIDEAAEQMFDYDSLFIYNEEKHDG